MLNFSFLFSVRAIRDLIVNLFHILFYGSDRLRGNWRDVNWLGVKVMKCPFDLWIYQEIIQELKPEKIIETGTNRGGSALFLASICDQVKNGLVITIDIEVFGDRPQHPRITYLQGSSTDQAVVGRVQDLIDPMDKVLVILDSNHKKDHVRQEMGIYSQFVTLNSYLIVEDTNINGHPVWRDYGPGPMEAVKEFIASDHRFNIDKSREKLGLTFNPNGYLKRTK
jgi:cephalosporin hydroxylase